MFVIYVYNLNNLIMFVIYVYVNLYRYGYSSIVLKHGCFLMFGGYESSHRIGDSLVKVSMISMFMNY